MPRMVIGGTDFSAVDGPGGPIFLPRKFRGPLLGGDQFLCDSPPPPSILHPGPPLRPPSHVFDVTCYFYRRTDRATMAGNFLRELKQFVVSDVQISSIFCGSFCKVEEVMAFEAICARKTIHSYVLEKRQDLSLIKAEFVRECKLMSTLRHRNIVRFLGVASVHGSQLPALVMERLLTSLQDLLAPDRPLESGALPFFSMARKCSVLQNVACGLAYLHQQSPPVIHRYLSAKNILLNSEMVAKIDLGVARIVTWAKRSLVYEHAVEYTPPEAFSDPEKYGAGIDVFAVGVITIFTIGKVFPCDLLPVVYKDKTGSLVPRTELERRSEYMQYVNSQLHACGQHRNDNPLVRVIEQCLLNDPQKRPTIREVLLLLEKAGAGIIGGDCERNKHDQLQSLPKHQVCFIHTNIYPPIKLLSKD